MRISDWSSDVCSSDLFPLAIFPFPDTRTGFQLLHGTKVPSMSDWQTQMAGLVQNVPENRTDPFNLGVSAILTPFRRFLQNAWVILSSFDAFRMEAFKDRKSTRLNSSH